MICGLSNASLFESSPRQFQILGRGFIFDSPNPDLWLYTTLVYKQKTRDNWQLTKWLSDWQMYVEYIRVQCT